MPQADLDLQSRPINLSAEISKENQKTYCKLCDRPALSGITCRQATTMQRLNQQNSNNKLPNHK